MTIQAFILTASVMVSILFFGGTYYANSLVFGESIQDNALESSDTLAQLTFNSMFQLMSTGWTRIQVLQFIRSTHRVAAGSAYSVDIYRGDIVAQRFGSIPQPKMDASVRAVIGSGEPLKLAGGNRIRYVFPLKAQDRCLRCHANARVGEVLGAIDVREDLGPIIARATHHFLVSLAPIAPIPFLVAFLVTVLVNRRIDSSIELLEESVAGIHSVADLRNLSLRDTDFGFAEINRLFGNFETLAKKLRSVAVDKDILEFEIKLLEKFVITSDVVHDWREYLNRLLLDINRVIEVYALFALFRVGDELFELEVFWRSQPTPTTQALLEETLRGSVTRQSAFDHPPVIEVRHHVANAGATLPQIGRESIEAKVKALFLETPRIGGIVAIGLHAELGEDETRALVMDSILSTLLNVIGSVKAIDQYTMDLEYYATRDPLTKLYNQRVFWELLTYEVSRAARHEDRFCLLMIDLDNFKLVNDSYGHAFGDRFLKEFADVLHQALRAGDALARYAGDEFVVILPQTGLDEARFVAQRILECAGAMRLTAVDGVPVRGAVSIGIAQYPDHAREPKDLFLFSDNMMYKAKGAGKGRIGMPGEEDVIELFQRVGEKGMVVLNAIESSRIVPYFQPILRLHDRGLEAVEVLARIRRDDGGIVGAGEFVEIAERVGVIHKLDVLMIQKTCQAVKRSGYAGCVFVNVSPRSLAVAEFAPAVRAAVRDASIDPARVVFEITERDTIKNTTLLAEFIEALRRDGFRFAIDDFGAGFSSFQYLKRLPIDFVKIEGEFVAHLAANHKDRAFVRSIAALAQALGIRTVAEHVESAEVLEQVRRAGIDCAQGFYVGEPLPRPPDAEDRRGYPGASPLG